MKGRRMNNMYNDKSADYFAQARTEIEPLLPPNAARVLEIGCGAGGTMRWLRGRRTVQYAAGMEMAPEQAVLAATAFDLVLTGNAETLDIPPGGFDLIIILDVLEHLVDPWTMVQRLHSALNVGGAIIASIPNVGHYSVAFPLLRGKWEYEEYGILDRTHLRFFTKRTAFELMSRPGLVVEKSDRTWHSLSWLPKSPKHVRWYVNKLLALVIPDQLITYQFLIRSVRAG
jgi:SAM-dependent methyltransferase